MMDVPSLLFAASENWQMHGLFTKAAVNGITELLYLIPSQEALPDNSRALLEALHGAFVTLVSGMPTGGAAPAGLDLPAWQELGGRVHERVSKAIISYLDNFAIVFAGKKGGRSVDEGLDGNMQSREGRGEGGGDT